MPPRVSPSTVWGPSCSTRQRKQAWIATAPYGPPRRRLRERSSSSARGRRGTGPRRGGGARRGPRPRAGGGRPSVHAAARAGGGGGTAGGAAHLELLERCDLAPLDL